MIIIAAVALLGFVTLAISAFAWRRNKRPNLQPTNPTPPTPVEEAASSRLNTAVSQIDEATRQIDDAFAQIEDGMNRTFDDMQRTFDTTFSRLNQALQNPSVNYTVTTTRTVFPRVPPASRPQPGTQTPAPATAPAATAAKPEVPVGTIYDHLRKEDESL